jgi:uncharacterized protein YndB with AHSA1/START domain
VVSEYSFLTTWCLEASIEPVWDAIHDSERWPQWWRGVEKVVEIEPAGENDTGQVAEYTWKSRLPYELRFLMRSTRSERPHLLEGEASGELAGTGRWRLFEAPFAREALPGWGRAPNLTSGRARTPGDVRATAVLYEWDVRTTRAWMHLLAPVARPIFAWNHDHVMRNGAEGLSRLLGARLLTAGGGAVRR